MSESSPARSWRAATKAVAVPAFVAAGLAACTNEISGTPVAGPMQTVTPTTTRTTTSSPAPTSGTTPSPTTSGVPTPTLIPTPNGAATTCQDYQTMHESGQLAVINAIGAGGNSGVSLNPKLWVSIADALCSFAAPGTTVKDVLTGKGIG